MTKGNNPRVSIGMPIYDAERFLAAALDSLLAQTFEDFELVISDNGSSDRTEEICRAYAARDSRIRYFRNETNRGAAWNHNRVLELSSGEYFKWASYDDLCAPEFLEKCVAILDREPAVVLCCAKLMDIDDEGKRMAIKGSAASKLLEPQARFRALIYIGHTCEEVYGLMRSEVLRKTRLIGSYTASDQVLLAELALHGRFYELPEVLFYHRWHSASTYRRWPDRNQRWLWFDPSAEGRILSPYWRQFGEYLWAIRRSPARWGQRARCYVHMGWWLGHFRRYLPADVYWAVRALIIRSIKTHMPWVRTAYRALKQV